MCHTFSSRKFSHFAPIQPRTHTYVSSLTECVCVCADLVRSFSVSLIFFLVRFGLVVMFMLFCFVLLNLQCYRMYASSTVEEEMMWMVMLWRFHSLLIINADLWYDMGAPAAPQQKNLNPKHDASHFYFCWLLQKSNVDALNIYIFLRVCVSFDLFVRFIRLKCGACVFI